MKQTADLKLRKPSVNEKAILLPKKIKLQTAKNSVFETQVTMFVPKPKTDKPMPKIALTIVVGHDQVRMVSDSIEALKDYVAELYAMLDENEEAVTKALTNARSEYILAIEKQFNETPNRMTKNRSNVIQMPKKAI